MVDDVDSLHVEIDNLNDLLVGFYFIRSIDLRWFTIYSLRRGAKRVAEIIDGK
jgi:hypothetical protein